MKLSEQTNIKITHGIFLSQLYSFKYIQTHLYCDYFSKKLNTVEKAVRNFAFFAVPTNLFINCGHF